MTIDKFFTVTSNLIQCASCNLSYDPLMGHACPNDITTSTVTTGYIPVNSYCVDCDIHYTGNHSCNPPSRHPILGLEQRYIFRMEDLV